MKLKLLETVNKARDTLNILLEQRKLFATGIAGSTMAQEDAPLPPKKEAVYVFGICRQVDGKDTNLFDLVGTAFAVSHHRLLTCYHVLFDDDVGITAAELSSALEGISSYIGSSATRLPLSSDTDAAFSFAMQGTIEVTMVTGSFTEDWLLLQCKQVLPSFLTICPAATLPNVDTTSVAIRLVHCPVGKFVADPRMKALRSQVLQTSVIEISDNIIEIQPGLVTGSSGGVYIDHLGLAVAIHLECTDELKSRTTNSDSVPAVDAVPTAAVGVATRKVKFETELNVQTAVVRNKRYINKMLSKKHMSFGRGLMISTAEEKC